MKKIYLIMLLLFAGFSAKATIHVVNVSNFSFSPNAISNVIVGDTIRWHLVSGSHTTTSASVPVGAATWDHFMTSTDFDYKVTVAGNYGYVCTPHAGSGMVGGFSASNGTASIDEPENPVALKAFPNPFKTKLSIPNKTADNIEIMSVLGEKVKTVAVNNNEKYTVLDLSELKKGVYFYVLKQEGEILETRRIVKSE